MTTLLIIGGTARAAAHSSLRAGLSPQAADIFRDRDLAAIAPSLRVPADSYPNGLDAIAAQFPPGPWIYTGALENHPDVVSRIAASRPLWGNGLSTLRAVRSPTLLSLALEEAGLPHPEVTLEPESLPRDGSWIRKPIASAGGSGVDRLVPDLACTHKPCYYQRFIDGDPLSATFIGFRSGAVLAGVTRQLLGHGRLPFAYRGSIAPWIVSSLAMTRITDVGNVVARRFGLVGLFGIDLVLNDDEPWPVEVNPRYTASVEVLELATGHALLTDHQAACEGGIVSQPAWPAPSHSRFVAKAVVFADRETIFAIDAPAPLPDFKSFSIPEIGDLPEPGSRHKPGAPILTVFASGSTVERCLEALADRHAEWTRFIAS